MTRTEVETTEPGFQTEAGNRGGRDRGTEPKSKVKTGVGRQVPYGRETVESWGLPQISDLKMDRPQKQQNPRTCLPVSAS